MEPERLKLLEHRGFGHWLAGFIDGEGSFNIRPTAKSYAPTMMLSVRADDHQVLLEAAYRTGVGKLRVDRARKSTHGDSVTWAVTTKADCRALVEVLDLFPLRAKKAKDYAIWREAVINWTTVKRGRWVDESWEPMRDFKKRLEAGRRYELAGLPPGAG